MANLDGIVGEEQNPGTDFDHAPLAPNCHAQAYRQPEAEISKKIDADIEAYLQSQTAEATDMFDYLYKELPKALKEQRDELQEELS